MRLRNRDSGESVVSEAPEGTSPDPRRARITMWLYGLFLLGILGFALWYAVYSYYHYEAQGQIRVARTIMSPERGGRIQAIYPDEDDAVLRGDSLMLVKPGTSCQPSEASVVVRDRWESTQQADLYGLRIENLEEELARKRRELARLDEREILELRSTESRRNELEEQVHQIQDQIDELRLEQEQARVRASRLAGAGASDPACAPFVVSAPHSGWVREIHEQPFTVVDAGTPVLSLTRPSSRVVVLAYLDRDFTGYVHRDDTVRVRLPDGSTTRGAVRDTYSSAQDFVEVKYDVYRPYGSQLLAEIEPATQAAKKRWRGLDRVDVEVEGEIGQ